MYPTLRKDLFANSKRKNYSKLKIAKEEINTAIFSHPEFKTFSQEMDRLFSGWRKRIRNF
ncbi:MAG: hypothetical protein WDN75_14615 [Bacteroidota bacterium]